MAIQSYQIRLKDHSGAQVALFTGYGRGAGQAALRSLYYKRRVRTLGQFSFALDGNDSRVPLLRNFNYQVEIWRRDPLAGLTWLGGLPSWRIDGRTLVTGWYKDFEGFIRGWKKGFNSEGRRYFYVQGRQYNDLLLGEPIRYAKGTAQALKTGFPGAVAAEYVNENIGAGAGVDGLGNTRVRTGVTEVVESDTAAAWSGDRANQNLLDVLQDLAEYGPGDFMMVGTGAATFEFRWRATRWGLDASRGNTGGVPPVVFSAKNFNTETVEVGQSVLDEINAVYAAGQGQANLRNYRTRVTAAATAYEWSRRAAFRDARDTNDNAALDDRADAELDNLRSRKYAKFNVIQTTATRYGRDWDLGYLTTFEDDDGTEYDFKVWGVGVRVDSDGNTFITPELVEE